MRFLVLLAIVTGANFGHSCQHGNTGKSKQPNIILIMADDMGYECLGCNGGLSYQTPDLDNMARRGMRFTHCYSQPLCTPSRVKLMTGKYNYRNYLGFEYLDPGQKTFGNVMKEAGYSTCIVGKWQLNGIQGFGSGEEHWPGWEDKRRPAIFGFEEYCLWQLTKRQSRYADPLIEQNGEVLTGLEDGYGPDVFCDYAMDFIERNKDRPFFLYYPMVLPHSPFVPTPDSKSWADKESRDKNDNRHFKDMVEYTDKLVGLIFQKVEDLGIAENTLIIFTGDNGTNRRIVSLTRTGEYPGGKGTTPDAGTHVPLIAYWPGHIEAGSESEALVDFSDFFPTFAEIAGKEVVTDGQSFFPLLKGEQYQEKSSVFVHYDLRLGPGKHDYHDRFARSKDYKLYQDGRFYHIPTDKWEKHPVGKDDLSWEVIQTRDTLQEILDQAPEWKEIVQ